MFMALPALASVLLTNVIKICSHLIKKPQKIYVSFGLIIKDQNCILSAPTQFMILNAFVFSRVLTKLGILGPPNTLRHLTAIGTILWHWILMQYCPSLHKYSDFNSRTNFCQH